MFYSPDLLAGLLTLADAAATQAASTQPAEVIPLFSVQNLVALITLTLLEVTLGIDNIVVIAILCGKLPEHQRAKARQFGLMLALVSRVVLLFSITWVMKLTTVLFTIGDTPINGKGLILIGGGIFLLWKTTKEIYHASEGQHDEPKPDMNNPDVGSPATNKELAVRGAASFTSIIMQIVVIDMVFSLDSVITAVGMAQNITVMVVAVVICVLIMMKFAGPISNIIDKHPSLKMLALSFLILIGVLLIAEGFHQHIPKGYIYTSMAFSLFVEMMNIRSRTKAQKQKSAPLTEDGGS